MSLPVSAPAALLCTDPLLKPAVYPDDIRTRIRAVASLRDATTLTDAEALAGTTVLLAEPVATLAYAFVVLAQTVGIVGASHTTPAGGDARRDDAGRHRPRPPGRHRGADRRVPAGSDRRPARRHRSRAVAPRPPVAPSTQRRHHPAPGGTEGSEFARMGRYAAAELERLVLGQPLDGLVRPDRLIRLA